MTKKWVFVSDVHIKSSGDQASQLFSLFCEKVIGDANVEKVFLLGDIIDLMVGPYGEYTQEYSLLFDQIDRFLESGMDVHFFEGNHDFHVEEVFAKRFGHKKDTKGTFSFHDDSILLTDEGKRFFIGHGDTIEIENPSYQVYKRLITSRFIKLLLDQVVSYRFVSAVGRWASSRSRKRNTKRYSDPQSDSLIRERFRESARRVVAAIPVSYVICGHSHVQDHYQFENGTHYLNNGYFLKSKTYLEIEGSLIRFVSLE